MTRYAIIGTLALLCAALGWIALQSSEVAALRDENAALTIALSAAEAKSTNITEDKKSDAAIDNMPDLNDVPPSWLMPSQPGSGGLY